MRDVEVHATEEESTPTRAVGGWRASKGGNSPTASSKDGDTQSRMVRLRRSQSAKVVDGSGVPCDAIDERRGRKKNRAVRSEVGG